MRTLVPVLFLVACAQDVKISERLDAPPLASITAPEEGATFSELDAIEFVGLVSDGNGLDDLVTLSWASDLDGELATIDSAPPDRDGLTRYSGTLSPGAHAITLSVVDSTDLRAQATVSVVVTLADVMPVAEITLPAPFSTFWPGEDIQLVGGASDPNQAPETLDAVWSYEPFDGGARTVIGSLSPTPSGSVVSLWTGAPIGSWRVFLEVTDDDGNAAEAEIVLEVGDPNEGDADQDGWTITAGDCDDTNELVHPGLDEACDGLDNDCNTVIDDKDLDNDDHVDDGCTADYPGPMPADDCDDANGTVFPGAAEQADGLDNDCNGRIDDGLSNFDNDGDCFCTALTCIGSVNPSCASLASGDCDDTDPDLNPLDLDSDGDSTCDGDCDDGDPWWNATDADGDGSSTCEGDCDDGDAVLNVDDTDNDGASSCDGDCDDLNAALNVLDGDGDGASSCDGDCNDASSALNLLDLDGDGFSTCAGDCNDIDDLVSPDDNDGDGTSACDGDCDDGDPALNVDDADGDGYSTCALDCDDGDGFLSPADVDLDGWSTCAGDCNDLVNTLTPVDADLDGASSCAGDCNDANASLNLRDLDGDGWTTCAGDCDDNSGALNQDDLDSDGYSTCEGDCDDGNGLLDPADRDLDTFSSCDGDCADNNGLVFPGQVEVPYNGIDDDCVGGDERDVDNDGYDSTTVGGTDCNDNNFAVKPSAIEACNGIDDDCDTSVDEQNATGCTTYYYDFDRDGYGGTLNRCLCSPGAVANYDATVSGDCYDLNLDAHPGQTTYFYDHRGDGSWDYSCDGVQTKIDNRTAVFTCTPNLFSCTYSNGWETGVPGCGDTSTWGTGCYYFPLISCEPLNRTVVDQSCR